jgi:HD-like signal output (HDOD) protein
VKRRVLFVDDEPAVLEGLRNLLHRQRRKWEMEFVGSGAAALECFERAPFDVIVSDMRMPRMDGSELLKRVMDGYPNTVRIVLSGHAELEAALRAVPVAHQFLTKPCKAEVLESTVERACNLYELVGDDAVRRVIGGIERLPPVPSTYAELTRVLANSEAGVDDAARVIKQDVSMTAKLLQLVNSAFFTTGGEVSTIEAAVMRLGFQTIKGLVLTVEVFVEHPGEQVDGITVESLRDHGVLAGEIARGIVDGAQQADDAFTAGMLHDIGKLLLLAKLPDHLRQALDLARRESLAQYVAEQRLFGVTHAEIGAYLLALWGLPYPIVEAVANHHTPSRVESADAGVLLAVHVANGLAHEIESGATADRAADLEQCPLIDRDYLARVGAAERLDDWRARVREEHADGVSQ